MRRSIRRFLALAVVSCAALVLLAGCGGARKGSPTIQVTVTASADCNNCGGGAASALKFRVFQVADSGAVRTMLNKGLPWGKHLEAGGANILVKAAEDFVSPGASKTVATQRDPKATALVVEGNFCKKVGATWYVVHPLAKKGPLLVTAGPTGLTVTPRK
ncbi:MAG: type VI secretion system lipoprotein TssJ [Candidatus Eisenbacteria bacterium]|uniref:Type VI secretion system lipoprotein TssJ n=1 Tax=Eiseniibacteriota bacterium TaxID=2212470 RepID=A0A933SD85_UNCEI|nr:type VI secretion system lipoprotein TssJ [Candidatus Eisenbacteria bacterium]